MMPKIPFPPKGVSNNPLMQELGLTGRAIAEPVTPERNLRDAIDITGNVQGESSLAYNLDDFYDLMNSGNYPDLYDDLLNKLDTTIFDRLMAVTDTESGGRTFEGLMSSIGSGKSGGSGVDPQTIDYLRKFREQSSLDPEDRHTQGMYKSMLNRIISDAGLSKDSPVSAYAALLSATHDLKNNAWSAEGSRRLLQSTLLTADKILGDVTANRPDFVTKLLNDTITEYRPGGVGQGPRADYPMRGMADAPTQYQNAIPSGPPQSMPDVEENHINAAVDQMRDDPSIDTRAALESETAGRMKAIEEMMLMIGGKRRPGLGINYE